MYIIVEDITNGVFRNIISICAARTFNITIDINCHKLCVFIQYEKNREFNKLADC